MLPQLHPSRRDAAMVALLTTQGAHAPEDLAPASDVGLAKESFRSRVSNLSHCPRGSLHWRRYFAATCAGTSMPCAAASPRVCVVR
jgi:hypothetical protein